MTGSGNSKRIDYFLFLVILISFPVNITLVSGLRISDFVLLFGILYIVLYRRTVWTGESELVLMFAVVVLVSLLYGYLAIGLVKSTNIFFLYKYSLPVLTVILLRSIVLSMDQTHRLVKLQIAMFIFMCLYVYAHIVLVLFGVIRAHLRVSFPFSFLGNSELVSDAPLYSAYLSNSFCFFYILTDRKIVKLPKIVFVSVILLFIPTIVLTGSRTGMMSAAISLFLYEVYNIVISLIRGSARINTTKVALVLILILGLVLLLIVAGDTPEVRNLVDRATNLDFANDISSQSRIRKMGLAIDSIMNENAMLIGIGMQSTRMDWIDSSIGALLLMSGGLGLVLVVSIILMYLARMKRENKRSETYIVLLFVVINYVLSNLISEYFLVTRSVLPFLINLVLLEKLMYDERRMEDAGSRPVLVSGYRTHL
jgi:hypothetical protein